MVQVQQHLLSGIVALSLLAPGPVQARRFYPDDPIAKMPPPMAVKADERELSEWFDYFLNTFGKPAHPPEHGAAPPSGAINTMGEVPDSEWYTNRHGMHHMTIAELKRGPGDQNDPTAAFPWKVTGAKTQGITPGLRIQDAKGRRFLLKFDPLAWPEIQSSVDAIGARFFYALGYNAPENYVVNFGRKQLSVDPKAKLVDDKGRERAMEERDIDLVLDRVPSAGGQYRGLASLFLKGKPVGPFRYHGTRSDDPNDLVAHQDRRDLRGLYVFSSWLNHTDTKSINSLDTLVEENGVPFIRHHLIDFGAILGSDSFEAKSPRAGNVYLFDWNSSAKAFFSLGFYVPEWAWAHYPHIRGVGHFESETFEPAKWHNNYYNAAFVNLRPDDAFWAAKQIMAFSEPEIRALVEMGKYTDPRATDYLVKTLVARQQKIGRTWFEKVLPLDRFRVENGRLAYDDLAAKYGFVQPRRFDVQWFRFDERNDQRSALSASGDAIPAADSRFLAAEIKTGGDSKSVVVYLRRAANGWEPVGLDRNW